MNNILGARDERLSLIELRVLIKKITECLSDLHVRNIQHRNLNINDVMVHFPELEPTTEEMQDSNVLRMLDHMEDQVIQSIQNLTDANFSVKIIDFG